MFLGDLNINVFTVYLLTHEGWLTAIENLEDNEYNHKKGVVQGQVGYDPVVIVLHVSPCEFSVIVHSIDDSAQIDLYLTRYVDCESQPPMNFLYFENGLMALLTLQINLNNQTQKVLDYYYAKSNTANNEVGLDTLGLLF